MQNVTLKLDAAQLEVVLKAHVEGRLHGTGSRSKEDWDNGKGNGCLYEHALGARTPDLWKLGIDHKVLDYSLAKFDYMYDEDFNTKCLTRDNFRAFLIKNRFVETTND